MITPDDLVRREVFHTVSYLVATLANADYDHGADDLGALMDQAQELCAPIDDWEEAARDAGWKPNPNGNTNWVWKDDLGEIAAESWQDACEQEGIDPHQWEIYGHWIISDWLADKLEEHGEKVDRDFAGLTIWARTTTDQAIALDSVIVAICDELNKGA